MGISDPKLFGNNTVENREGSTKHPPNGPSAKSGGDRLLAGASANADLRRY